MSTLEERREARRRRRQQEEEDDVSDEVVSPESPYNIEKKKQDREDRLQRIAAGYNTINGEDELERRRRERREQRLRSGAAETPSEDSSSRRSRRRRGTEDDIDTSATEEVTTTRSRRRRGQEDEETDSAPVSVPEPVSNDTEEEDRRRQQEAEEEAERQRQAEAARRRAQEEEEAREREEQERRREEEERRQAEERRRRDQSSTEESETSSIASMDSDKSEKDRVEHERKVDEQLKRLKSLEKTNDLLLNEEDSWTKTSNGVPRVRRKSDERGKIPPKEPAHRSVTEYSLRAVEDGKCEKLKSFFEDKKEEQMNGELPEMSRSLNFSKKSTINSSLEDRSPVHEKMRKFETHQQPIDQDSKKDNSVFHERVISPGTARLRDIQKKFEDKSSNNTENSSSRLGRFSISEGFLNETPVVQKDNKKHILDRWQSVIEPKKSTVRTQSILSKSMSTSYEYDLHKKGDNIGKLTSKFDHNRNEKPIKFVKSATLPHNISKDMSSLMKQWSIASDDSSKRGAVEEKNNNRHYTPKVMDRWRHHSPTTEETHNSLQTDTKIRPKSASSFERSRESCLEQNSSTGKITSKSSAKSEEEERLERERREAEEREREEAERIMEEQQKKKKGKRKGLGGLSPEKKKMLKDDDDEYSLSEDEDDPYYSFINERSKFWNAEKTRVLEQRITHIPNLEGMQKGDLVKLCKQLHQQLSKLEEEVYDWEVKIRKQDQEIIQLTLKVNDSKGKFAKPVLKKVNKTESKLNKIASKKDKADFRDNLKSSGQSKYTLDEEGGEAK